MESHLYSIVTIRSLRDSVRNDWFIAREYHIQPSEILRMPYYQYEWLIEDIQQDQKRQEEQRKQDEKNRNQYMPKLPKTPTYKPPAMPKISIPKF